MLIEVKQEHIAKGVRQNCSLCPVALAIHAKMKTDCGAECSVMMSYVQLFLNYVPKYNVVRLPVDVSKWIERFDNTGVGEPFSFELVAKDEFFV